MYNLKIAFILSAVIGFITSATSVSGQEAVLVTGGDASGSAGSVSYSIGQLFYNTNSIAEGYLCEGVQQPFEIIVVMNNDQDNTVDMLFTAYPNPVESLLLLKTMANEDQKFSYRMFNNNGKLLKTESITGTEVFIPMSDNPSGIYFLVVLNKNEEVKTFKIIKK